MKPASVLIILLAVVLVVGKKKEEPLNRNTRPFWLRDSLDGMCLGPDGFGSCDMMALWIFAASHAKKDTKAFVSMFAPEPDRMCLGSSGRMFSSLRRVGVSKCGNSNAKNMEIASVEIQGTPGFLIAQGKNCLARAQGRLRNTADMQLCTTGTPLDVVETNLHKAGMQIMTIDGFCFDGARFRNCNDGDPMLRWGIGLDFRSTEPSRNIFSFFDQEKCAVREGEVVKKGDCNRKGAARWGWRDGKLSQGGTHCLGRARDNTAMLVPCSEGYEYVDFVMPEIVPTPVQPKAVDKKSSPRRFEM